MKCKDCSACHKGYFKSKPDAYVCIGVPEPFVIENINNECTEYSGRRNKKRITIEDAINHFKYGISHDIFSEPVTSYAKMTVEALEKQISMKPIEIDKYDFGCPCCKENLAITKDDIYVYEMIPPRYCDKCGQRLDWN